MLRLLGKGMRPSERNVAQHIMVRASAKKHQQMEEHYGDAERFACQLRNETCRKALDKRGGAWRETSRTSGTRAVTARAVEEVNELNDAKV